MPGLYERPGRDRCRVGRRSVGGYRCWKIEEENADEGLSTWIHEMGYNIPYRTNSELVPSSKRLISVTVIISIYQGVKPTDGCPKRVSNGFWICTPICRWMSTTDLRSSKRETVPDLKQHTTDELLPLRNTLYNQSTTELMEDFVEENPADLWDADLEVKAR